MGMLERLELQDALERFFEGRRASFLQAHGLVDKPALVLQCVPDEPLSFDLVAQPLADALIAGGGPSAQEGWWNELKVSGQPALMFDGLTSKRNSYPDEWATELHDDGSLVAGVWHFPGVSSYEPKVNGIGITDDFTQLFEDFAYLAANVYRAIGYSSILHVTCTMHLADRLPLLNGRGLTLIPASKRPNLRWPIASVESERIAAHGERMAAQFLRIYGKRPRK